MKYLKSLSIILFVVLADQITKYLFKGKTIELIKNVLSLNYTTNTGAAFGIFKGYNLILIIVTIIVIVLCFKWIKKKEFHYLPLSFIIGGAMGNLIDRLLFGYVRDFIDFKIWPVFNLADSFITIAIILIIYKKIKK